MSPEKGSISRNTFHRGPNVKNVFSQKPKVKCISGNTFLRGPNTLLSRIHDIVLFCEPIKPNPPLCVPCHLLPQDRKQEERKCMTQVLIGDSSTMN
jgi:hypothetical protein